MPSEIYLSSQRLVTPEIFKLRNNHPCKGGALPTELTPYSLFERMETLNNKHSILCRVFFRLLAGTFTVVKHLYIRWVYYLLYWIVRGLQ